MADPEMEVDSRKLKVKERQNSRKKRHNTENTECRGTKGTEGMTIPGIRAGPKNKNAPTVVGAHFSTGRILPEPYLVCQEENARKRAGPPGKGCEDYTPVAMYPTEIGENNG